MEKEVFSGVRLKQIARLLLLVLKGPKKVCNCLMVREEGVRRKVKKTSTRSFPERDLNNFQSQQELKISFFIYQNTFCGGNS